MIGRDQITDDAILECLVPEAARPILRAIEDKNHWPVLEAPYYSLPEPSADTAGEDITSEELAPPEDEFAMSLGSLLRGRNERIPAIKLSRKVRSQFEALRANGILDRRYREGSGRSGIIRPVMRLSLGDSMRAGALVPLVIAVAGCGASSATTSSAPHHRGRVIVKHNDPNCQDGIDSSGGGLTLCTRPRGASAGARKQPLTRAQVCNRFANFVSNYDYIQQGTSVRVYDILFHTLQRSCPKQAHAGGFDADAGKPACVNLYDSRFNCQAFNDPNFPSAPTSALISNYQGNG